MEHQEIALVDCDLKFAQTEGSFSGYGSVFGNRDLKNDVIMEGAYSEVLKSGDPVPIYINHGWLRGDLPVGSWNGLKQDARGLFGEAGLVMKMSAASDAYHAMKAGLVTGLSVAIIPDHKSIERRADGARVVRNIKVLKEISIVTEPANAESRVVSVKSEELMASIGEIKSVRDLEYFLRDAGSFSKAVAAAVVARVKSMSDLREAEGHREAEEEFRARIARMTA